MRWFECCDAVIGTFQLFLFFFKASEPFQILIKIPNMIFAIYFVYVSDAFFKLLISLLEVGFHEVKKLYVLR